MQLDLLILNKTFCNKPSVVIVILMGIWCIWFAAVLHRNFKSYVIFMPFSVCLFFPHYSSSVLAWDLCYPRRIKKTDVFRLLWNCLCKVDYLIMKIVGIPEFYYCGICFSLVGISVKAIVVVFSNFHILHLKKIVSLI